MTSNKKIYDTITGSEKNRFMKEMGQVEYDKLVSHLRKVLGPQSVGIKDGDSSILPGKKAIAGSKR
jgi:hypothetical protein